MYVRTSVCMYVRKEGGGECIDSFDGKFSTKETARNLDNENTKPDLKE